MATKYYLLQSKQLPTPTVEGKDLNFEDVCYMPACGGMWATFSTDSEKEQAVLASDDFKHIKEISEEDFGVYERQKAKLVNPRTVFTVATQGIGANAASSAVAITVDEPRAAAPVESAEEILATKVTPKKK